MTILYVPVFHGIAPRLAPRKLSTAQSQIARDCDLFSEELRPLRDSIEVNTPTKVGTKNSIYLLGSLWLHWLTDVDVARSPLFIENDLRVHYTGDMNPKSTDDTLAAASGTDYPTDSYRLGIPRPDTAPTVSHTGGTGNDIERGYAYTFVSAWGEEGPPSPATNYVGKADATSWDITTLDATPPNQWTHAADIASIAFSSGTLVTVTLNSGSNHFFETTEYIVISGTTTGTGDLFTDIIGTWQVARVDELIFTFVLPAITSGTYTGGAVIDREAPLQLTGWTKRLYRTLGNTFRFVADGITGTTYTDTVADELLGEVLPGGLDSTKWWKAPNGNMKGMIAFPGGVMAGFFGNTLTLSEPNVPSAYPEEFQYTFNFEIVGIGVVGNSIVVVTDGFPSLVIGDDPGAMVQTELEIFQSCVSKRGIASLVNGVMYPSPDGLVYVPSAGMPDIITRDFFKKKDWDLFSPDTFTAGVFDDRYYAYYENGGVGGNERGGIIFDLKEPGATFTESSVFSDGVHSDIEKDNLYLVNNNDIVQWDTGGRFFTYTWLSKLFTTARPVSFTAAKVKVTLGDGVTAGEEAAAIAAAVAALEMSLLATALNSPSFGKDNNYVAGSFAGGSVGEYGVAGGPYASAVADIGGTITALMNIYAWFAENEGDSVQRHLIHTQELTGSKAFRVGNIKKGFLSDQWEVEFNCNDVVIHEAIIGTSMRELSKA